MKQANDRIAFNSCRAFGNYAVWMIQRMFEFDPSALGGPAPQMPESVAVPAMV